MIRDHRIVTRADPQIATRVFKHAVEIVALEAISLGVDGRWPALGEFLDAIDMRKTIEALGIDQKPPVAGMINKCQRGRPTEPRIRRNVGPHGFEFPILEPIDKPIAGDDIEHTAGFLEDGLDRWLTDSIRHVVRLYSLDREFHGTGDRPHP